MPPERCVVVFKRNFRDKTCRPFVFGCIYLVFHIPFIVVYPYLDARHAVPVALEESAARGGCLSLHGCVTGIGITVAPVADDTSTEGQSGLLHRDGDGGRFPGFKVRLDGIVGIGLSVDNRFECKGIF